MHFNWLGQLSVADISLGRGQHERRNIDGGDTRLEAPHHFDGCRADTTTNIEHTITRPKVGLRKQGLGRLSSARVDDTLAQDSHEGIGI